MKDFDFHTVSIDKEAVDSPLGEIFDRAEIVEEAPVLSFNPKNRHHLHISKKAGAALHQCASLNPEYICCNTRVLRFLSNCPFDCSYCFLKSYLNNGATLAVADMDGLMAEVREKTSQQPWRFFRIGTWELADSLALEPRLGTASELVLAFSKLKNAVLELKTKSDCVEPVLDLDHRGRTIISWSFNPDEVVKAEEHGTSSLDERLDAMRAVVSRGYMTAIHFDPMIHHHGWEEGYDDLARRIFETVPQQKIAWISIGALRFNPEMKKTIEKRFPKSKLTSAEMVLGPDGKVRYVKPLRLRMFSLLYDAIRRYGGEKPFVYLCMERWDVWERILGYAPRSIGHLDYLITQSLYTRFPGLVHRAPDLALYKDL